MIEFESLAAAKEADEALEYHELLKLRQIWQCFPVAH